MHRRWTLVRSSMGSSASAGLGSPLRPTAIAVASTAAWGLQRRRAVPAIAGGALGCLRSSYCTQTAPVTDDAIAEDAPAPVDDDVLGGSEDDLDAELAQTAEDEADGSGMTLQENSVQDGDEIETRATAAPPLTNQLKYALGRWNINVDIGPAKNPLVAARVIWTYSS